MSFDVRRRLEAVVENEKMSGERQGTYVRSPKSLSTWKSPTNGLLAFHGSLGDGQRHRHDEQALQWGEI